MATTQQQRQELNKTYMNGKSTHLSSQMLTLLRWQYFPNWSEAVPNQYPSCLFFLQKLTDPKIHMKRGTKNTQITLKKNDKTTVSTSQFQNLKTKVMKTWYRHKHTKVNGWDEIKNPETNHYIYDQLIFEKTAKTIPWRKKSFFNKRF